ncbi:hypothetical protein ES703_10214 [subsurface metagenome]
MSEGKQKFIGGIDFDELKAQRIQLYNTITIDLATARTNEEMVFTGNYIYALEATDVDANVDVRFNELFRAAINVKEGRGIRVPFYRLYISNAAQAGKSVTLAIGIEASDFEVFDVGKSLGITGTVDSHVLIDDSSFYETAQKRSFISFDSKTGVGGEQTLIQLWNPAASGVLLYLHALTGVLTATESVNLRKHDAALPDISTNLSNKYLDEAAPSGLVRMDTLPVAPGTVISQTVFGTVITRLIINPVIIIPEGWGLIIERITAATSMSAGFEWVEK